ncbi:inositol-polyphosphate multikinase [Exophiala viscosa]|uniref:Kinase n=1 Tax=Exophiala viscosa TaxID=2486360 RepID=A0AAN6DTI1_9EURO|nr:inositol-polyphosphate multikinase [Exophiala viscosa]KAI1624778.1 inositol-polyphosphate multikinase [Exophiala viscosa]
MTSSPAPPPSKRIVAIPAQSELVAFDHNAAGHEGISSNVSGTLIFKPCTQAEIDFYESAKDHPLFQAQMPTYIGALSLHDDQETVAPLLTSAIGTAAFNGATIPSPTLGKRASWKPSGGKKLSTGLAIVLENVAAGFKHPNILDVKLGARLWADDAPAAKRRKLEEVAGRTTSGSLGFRIAGMKIRHHHEDEDEPAHIQEDPAHVDLKNGYKSYTKLYGQSFNHHNVLGAFTTYLGGVHQDPATGKRIFRRKRARMIVNRFTRELESIQYVLENEESRMYSASVLMVYEADEEALERGLQEEENEQDTNHELDGEEEEEGEDDDDDDDDDDVIRQKVHEVRLIDFAHASWTPGDGPDENSLMGIRNMVRVLRELVS